MKLIFTFLFASAVLLNVVEAQTVGQSAPDFTLKDLSNTNYTLSENKGKVILVFLIGYNCPLCIASAPSVQSNVIAAFSGNVNFQALAIDVWNGSTSAVQGFKSSTGVDAKFLQKGSSVASSWSTTYDRLVVIDAEGKMAYKGSSAARSNVDAAKSAVQTALDNAVQTAVGTFDALADYNLGQNYPNPMQVETKIHFKIKTDSHVKLTVFDITGKVIAIPVNEFHQAGEHEVILRGNEYKRGIYLYTLHSNGYSATRRMIVQ